MKLTVLALLVGALATTGCAGKKPANLTPQASLAYENGRIVSALDDVRDVAIIANSFGQAPFSTAITRRLVVAHSSALAIIETRGTGWQKQVDAVLNEALKNVPAGEAHDRLAPYVELTKTLLNRLATREFDEQLSAAVLASYREALTRSAAVDADWLGRHP